MSDDADGVSDHGDLSDMAIGNRTYLPFVVAMMFVSSVIGLLGFGVERDCNYGYYLSNSYAHGNSVYLCLNSRSGSGSESASQTASSPCTFREMKIRVVTNNLNGIAVFTFRVNGANTSLAVTVSAGVIGVFTSTADVDVNDNDLVCYHLSTKNATSGAIMWLPTFRSTS